MNLLKQKYIKTSNERGSSMIEIIQYFLWDETNEHCCGKTEENWIWEIHLNKLETDTSINSHIHTHTHAHIDTLVKNQMLS